MNLTKLSKPELLALFKKQEQSHQEKLDSHQEKLQSQLQQQDIARQEHELKIQELTQQRDEYKLALDKLMQQRFRHSSERYLDDPDQLRLDFGDTDEAADAALGLGEAVEEQSQTIPAHQRRKPRRKKDEKLPQHLPRYEVTAPVPDATKFCGEHGERKLLPEAMWDKTETLEFKRPQLKVRVTIYPKYACEGKPACGIVSPPRPTGLVEGNRYDTSIAAEIITDKSAYHLPLYRQQDRFAGCGWVPSRGTLCNIQARAMVAIGELLKYFQQTLQTDGWIGCDDTGVTLLYPKVLPEFDLSDPRQRRIHEVYSQALAKKQPSINAKMWAYRGVTVKLNVFDFTVSRHRDGPKLFFNDFEGTLLGDCWDGFEAISVASNGRILRAACNAHARRKFENSSAYPDERRQWLLWYQELYDIEDRGRILAASDRLELRQQEAKPIWDTIKTWLAEVKYRIRNVILPKSDFNLGLNYVRNHFVELTRYLADGMLPFDNNETEQLMRQVALGRKNWMFAGSIEGGDRNAGLMTLVSSAVRNDLEVWSYVKDVLDELLAGRTDYEPLLPWNWAQSHPESIRQYRAEERRDRATRKRTHRATRRASRPSR